MALYRVAVKFLLLYLPLVTKAADYYIHNSSCDLADTIRNLNDHGNGAKVSSNSHFWLQGGTYHVNSLLKLDNISNVNFTGSSNNMTEIILGQEGCICISDSSLVMFELVTIIKHGQKHGQKHGTICTSSFIIHNSIYIAITSVVFTQYNFERSRSRAIHITYSSAEMQSCAFHNGFMENGGAVFATASNLTFSETTYFGNNSAMDFGGAIYSCDCTWMFTGNSYFTSNNAENGGAIYLHGNLMVLSENVTFTNNKGTSGGGALYLKNTAQIEFESSSDILFLENKAEKGGAIFILDSIANYVSQCHHGLISEAPLSCFFKVQAFDNSFTKVKINFEENYAELSGASLFGGFLNECRVQLNNVYSHMTGHLYLHNVSDFHNLTNETSDISSRPLKLCFCEDDIENCSVSHKSIRVKPGGLLSVSVISLGQFDLPSPSYVMHIFHASNTSEIYPEPNNFNLTKHCHHIRFTVFTSETEKTLTLFPEGCNSQRSSLVVTIQKEDCPPGFELIMNTCLCEEMIGIIVGENESCRIETGEIKLPKDKWIEPIFNNTTYQGFRWGDCPAAYCKSNSTWLDFSSPLNDISDRQCRENRHNTLCGACKDNHSLMLNSLDCETCSNTYLSLLILFVFAGIALIAMLLLLQMTVANGMINGLILYCNVVSICSYIFFPLDRESVPPLPVFVAWVNLDFGIPTCFYNGLDHYSYTWLQFVFPFYLWFLIGLIIIGCKLSSRISARFGSNPVAVLATVILMSFTKLLQTAEQALSYSKLHSTNGTRDIRWRMDPNIEFFRNEHVVLAIFSILVIVLLLFPYTALLTFGYRLQKYSGRRGFHKLNCLKPLLDAYYAPYTKNNRYWPGLLLIVRSLLFLGLPALRERNAVLVTLSSLFASLMAFAWLRSRIYVKTYVAVLEASFILNICILGITSYHVRTVEGNQDYVTYTSAAIAFAEFLGILLLHIVCRISRRYGLDLQLLSTESLNKLLGKLKTKKNAEQHSKEMHHSNTLTVSLREPLLDETIEL